MNRSLRQYGISLISLLIGLLVSSIILVGMMMIFRNTIQVIVPASETARAEGERVAALLASHALLQEAGFGILDAEEGAHFQVTAAASLSGGTLTVGSGTGKAVLWAKNIDGEERCEALFADGEGSLRLVTDDNCSDVTGGISGAVRQLVQPPRIVDDELGSMAIDITRTVESCSPFGIGESVVGDMVVTLSMPNATGQTVESRTCLVNIQP